MDVKFKISTLKKRISSMLKVDFKRLFKSSLFYIMLGISLVVPILILVMTTMMDGMVSVDPQTGVETIIEGFDNVWQIIGAIRTKSTTMDMSITSMCNINMMFFAIAAFVCVFISGDFRSGYVKNLFTTRAKKSDYVISKTIIGFFVSTCMLIAFFIGAIIGGGVSGLSFALSSVSVFEIIMCMLAKIFLALIFVAIYVLASVIAKQRLWFSIILSLGVGMLFFTMVPIITPLNSGILNVVLCIIGGALFSVGIGVGSNAILSKTSLI